MKFWSLMMALAASVLLSFSNPIASAPLTERQKIDAMLRAVETSGIRFIRNGIEYDGKRARAHMELKLSRSGGRIKTAEHFIQYLATKSSMTGRKYYVRLANGRKVESAVWLRGVLKRLEERAASKKAGRSVPALRPVAQFHAGISRTA